MQYKQTLLRLILFILPATAFSQTTYLPLGSRENVLIERLEIKEGKDSVFNYSKTKPYSRRQFIPHLAEIDSTQELSKVDAYNMRMALIKNLEWASGDMALYASKKPILKSFYKTPATLYEVHEPNFFLAVDPMFQYVVAKESNNSQHLFLNTRGVSIRGRIANKIGFAASATDNQERDPLYVQSFEKERKAVPGEGFYKSFKAPGGFDYFDARGYISFSAVKVIDIAFGYDKHFIGNGYRSLFLSDFSNSALFLKLNTRIWKINLQNLFMELQNNERVGADVLIPKKYAAVHHLDIGITKWLNVGLYEAVIFGREDHFEFGYLNPVIFYRSIEQQSNSVDNSLAGLDLKANFAKHFQVYSQFLLDEFNMVEAKKGSGWWGNKWGVQVGGKYIDAFNIKNLDLQLETNIVRPFTYSHRDSVANYTHYNQPLAHPLGANFKELIGIARYQPAPKWFLQAKAIYYKQGKDTGNVSYGSNIFYPNVPPYRKQDYGYTLANGVPTKVALASMLLSYEVRPNLFIEANGLYRKQSAPVHTSIPSYNSFTMSLGVRWNIPRREFDF